MPSWWGKSSSKDVKKKTAKENIIDTLNPRISPTEQRVGDVRVEGSRMHSDKISQEGSQLRAESQCTSPSSKVSRCQSVADRLHGPLPVPTLQSDLTCVLSGVVASKSVLETPGEMQPILPPPKLGHLHRSPDAIDIGGNLTTAPMSSRCFVDSDDPADCGIQSPVVNDVVSGGTGVSNINPRDQASVSTQKNSKELLMPENPLSNNQFLATPPKAGVLSNCQANAQSPHNGAFASAPAAPKPYPDVNFIGSGQCSSPGPGSRTHSSAVSPRHPQAGGPAPESPTSWHDEGKKSYRLPLPPISISNTSIFSSNRSTSTMHSLISQSPGRTDNHSGKGSRWKKGKLIGCGTFGRVFVGFNSDSGEMCAMKKVTLFSDDTKSKVSDKQLEQEITLLSQLQHPNIVQYYGFDKIDDKIYIYLEYVSGGSICELLQEYGPLGEQAIRSFTQQILSGLAYLHAEAIVHRDIKGANILVDPNGRVKLADFGMAKNIARQSCPLSSKGSPYWMAPEVIKNSKGCNLAVDIWSLGCTVLEMATSKPPWSQYEAMAAMFKIVNSEELPTIPDHLSEDGKDFIRCCLQREPSNRPTAIKLLEHPFVRNAVPMEKSILNPKLKAQRRHASIRGNFRVVGDVGNLSSLDTGQTVHQPIAARSAMMIIDSHARKMSCPDFPIVSPPSPQIPRPLTSADSSAPRTSGTDAIPFKNQTKQVGFLHKGFRNTLKCQDNIRPLWHTFNGKERDHYHGSQCDISMAKGHLQEPIDKELMLVKCQSAFRRACTNDIGTQSKSKLS